MDDRALIICASLVFENVYYIFRPIDDKSCLEVKVLVRDKDIYSSEVLNENEQNYFNKIVFEPNYLRMGIWMKYNQ